MTEAVKGEGALEPSAASGYEVRREFIKTDFGQIHLRISGKRAASLPPLICLHMAPQSGQDFDAFMKLAGRDRLIIAPDYPGYGESDPLSKDVPVSIETYARAIWQALDALNLKTVEILGYHTGSKVGIEMALQSPARTAKLFCISLSNMSREAYEARAVKFEPLESDSSGEWFGKLQNYYDPELPEDILKQKYTTSLKVGSRSHLGFIASHLYNADILRKLERLETLVGLINPNDDLKAITPQAADYIENCVLIDRPDWLPGFLDMKPQQVLDTINMASCRLDETYGAATTSLAF